MKGFVFLVLFLIISSCIYADNSFNVVDGIAGGVDVVKVNKLDAKMVLAASGSSLYKLDKSGQRFIKIYTFKGELSEINSINYDCCVKSKVYIATDSGLFISFDGGKNFKRVFKRTSSDTSLGRILFVAEFNNTIYAGTDSGLYFSDKYAYRFERMTGVPKSSSVFWVSADSLSGLLYAATSSGVYKISIDGVERIYMAATQEDTGIPDINMVSVNSGNVYIAGKDGILVSEDQGKNFKNLDSMYFRGMNVNMLVHKAEKLYAATDNGAYVLDKKDEELKKITNGIYSDEVSYIEIDDAANVWLATNKGLFVKKLIKNNAQFGVDFANNIPKIKELHKVVTKYNEIHASKISSWRKRVKLKAFFPEVDVDYDKTIYGTYSGGGQSHVGPRDWSLGLSWDVGEIIWTSDETSIDNRSKLNTQLRIDILDEINRVYFELKRTLLTNETSDKYPDIDRSLRIEELVAVLDAYSGGWFSSQL